MSTKHYVEVEDWHTKGDQLHWFQAQSGEVTENPRPDVAVTFNFAGASEAQQRILDQENAYWANIAAWQGHTTPGWLAMQARSLTNTQFMPGRGT